MTLIPGSHKNGKRETTFVKKESGLNDWRVQLKNGEEKEAVLAKIDPTDVILFDSDNFKWRRAFLMILLEFNIAGLGSFFRIFDAIKCNTRHENKRIETKRIIDNMPHDLQIFFVKKLVSTMKK